MSVTTITQAPVVCATLSELAPAFSPNPLPDPMYVIETSTNKTYYYTGGNFTSIPTISLPTRSFTNNASRSLVTTAAAANGFQLSSTRDAMVNYSVSIVTSSTLSGNSSGYVALEIAPTNSSTAGDWVEIGRTTSGQNNTLIVGITLGQTGGGQIGGMVPAGYYARLRSVNTAGTPTYTYNSGQEVLF